MPHAAPRGLVQYDERDRPYMMVQGRRYYISPMGMGESAPEDQQGATFFRERPTWNQHTGEWERPINFSNLLSLGAGAGIGAGALSAAGAFGGAGGAAGGAVTPTVDVAALPALTGTEFIGPELAGAAGGTAGGPSLARRALGLGGEGLPGGLARAGLLGGLTALGAATQGDERETSPELRRLWEQQLRRQQAQNPLYESILQLAYNRLPTASRAGTAPPSFEAANAQVPGLSAGSYEEPDELRQLFRQTEVRQQMSEPMFQAISQLAQAQLPRG